MPQITGTVSEAPIVGAPTEVYARVARGAMACWFGTSGPLKANYIYHAEAEPAAQGGKAEIIIHERDRTSDNPQGPARLPRRHPPGWRGHVLAVENMKLPEPLAKSMEADVRRWGAGAIGCADRRQAAGRRRAPQPPEAKPNDDKKGEGAAQEERRHLTAMNGVK